MLIMTNENLFEVITRALNRINNSLAGHSERVAFQMMRMMEQCGRFTPDEICQAGWVALFHNIGNFRKNETVTQLFQKRHELDDMTRYTYLFLKHFQPQQPYVDMIPYHKFTPWKLKKAPIPKTIKLAAGCLQIADAMDLYGTLHPEAPLHGAVASLRHRYPPVVLGAVHRCYKRNEMYGPKWGNTMHNGLVELFGQAQMTKEEKKAQLKTLIRAMDFRSHCTALHCSIVVRASDVLAELCGLDEQARVEVHMGAMLHDLGKLAIPLEILESPGKLTGQDWEIMKSHVAITEEILKGQVSEAILQIAIRHHEAPNGTGYPRGLRGNQLTLQQRIVAVGDIVSALSEKRSYKPAFPMDEVMRILSDMAKQGKICAKVFDVLQQNQNRVYQEILDATQQATDDFDQIYIEYYRTKDILKTKYMI